jgi:hypothetical protein
MRLVRNIAVIFPLPMREREGTRRVSDGEGEGSTPSRLARRLPLTPTLSRKGRGRPACIS